MASAVCAAIDAMKMREIVGSIAGDDTIMCAIRTVDDTYAVMKKNPQNCGMMLPENNIYRHAWERKDKICYKIYM